LPHVLLTEYDQDELTVQYCFTEGYGYLDAGLGWTIGCFHLLDFDGRLGSKRFLEWESRGLGQNGQQWDLLTRSPLLPLEPGGIILSGCFYIE
jgi:hypothetical protein